MRCGEVAVLGTPAAQPPQRLLDLGARVQGLPSVRAPDRVGEPDHGLGLVQVAARAGLDRPGERDLVGLSRQDDHRGAGGLVVDATGRLDAVDARHLQVHQHDVGVFLRGGVDRGLTVGDDLDHAEVLFLVEGHLERFAERTMIVGDHDGDGRMGPAGRHRGAS